jgi:hypothetical protein
MTLVTTAINRKGGSGRPSHRRRPGIFLMVLCGQVVDVDRHEVDSTGHGALIRQESSSW